MVSGKVEDGTEIESGASAQADPFQDLVKSAGGDGAQTAALKSFGLNLGIAYQVYDDCLDLFGSESSTGKSLGSDLAGGKITLPLLVALDKGSPADREHTLHLIQHWQPSHQQELQKILVQVNALSEAQATVQRFLDTALSSIETLPNCPSRNALEDLTRFLAQQTSQIGV